MKYVLIVNPVSGYKKGKKIMEKVMPILKSKGADVDVIDSEYEGHPYEITKSLNIENYNAILAIGGDGTMHEVINGMMDRGDQKKRPIGLITGGTGNSLMHDLDALDPVVAAKKIIRGDTMKIDLAKMEMQSGHMYSFNVVGWGLAVSIDQIAEGWRWVGGQRYNLASLIEIIRNPTWEVTITLDDQKLTGKYAFFLACNTVYSGNGMRVAPRAKMNDGLYDVVILKQAPRWKLIRLFSKIFSGRHIDDPLISYHQVKQFSITPKVSGELNVDGQVTGNTPVTVKVIENAMELLV